MKKDIHPTYYPEAKIHCACGNVLTVGTTKEDLQIETCSACHPFYTGKEKNLESVGRVQKFKERVNRATEAKSSSSAKTELNSAKTKPAVKTTKTRKASPSETKTKKTSK